MKIKAILRRENLYLPSECIIRLNLIVQSCESSIEQLKSTLKALKSEIPNIIKHIEAIQEVIDYHHKNVNKATVAGATTGIVGGGLMIGGIIAAFSPLVQVLVLQLWVPSLVVQEE